MAAPDLFPLTLETWTTRTEEVVDAIFEDGGVLSRHVRGYRPEPAQRSYALLLAKSAVRGIAPGHPGRVSMVEAGTGVGKTVAYIVVGLVSALLTGKRFMISTFTRQLLFQVVDTDAHLAVDVVAEVLGSEDGKTYGGRPIRVAPRRSRRAFVSPSRARAYADELRMSGADPEAVEALETCARLSEEATDRVNAGGTPMVVGNLLGLTETFVEDFPALGAALSELPPDRYNLTSTSPASEQVLWRAYQDNANTAVAVVVTHAAFIIDMSLHGRLSGARHDGFCLVVVDEAHDLERAARAAFGVKRSISELARDAARLKIAFAAETGIPAAARRNLDERLAAYGVSAQEVTDMLKADVKRRGDLPSFDIQGDEDWIDPLKNLRKAMTALILSLTVINSPVATEAAERIVRYDVEIENVLDVVRYRKSKGVVGLLRPIVSLTPVKQDPCLQVLPIHGQRIVSRIWSRGREGDRPPMADAVVFTSATLALPGREGWDAYAAMAWTLGIGKDHVEVNVDLCARIEPQDFGRPTFVWADPRAPYMTAEGGLSPGGAAYAAHAIVVAFGRPNAARGGTCRQVVLTRNFVDPEVIFELLPAKVRKRCVVRRRGESLAKAVAAWREMPDGILLTPGAFEGLNLPGLIDHLHLPRLPFPPPPEGDRQKEDYSGVRREMLQSLRQGFGRGIRHAADNPVVWVMDIRMPPPEAVQNRHRRFAAPGSEAQYLSAFPTRFARAMGRGEILDCPENLLRGQDAVPELAGVD